MWQHIPDVTALTVSVCVSLFQKNFPSGTGFSIKASSVLFRKVLMLKFKFPALYLSTYLLKSNVIIQTDHKQTLLDGSTSSYSNNMVTT